MRRIKYGIIEAVQLLNLAPVIEQAVYRNTLLNKQTVEQFKKFSD